MQINLDDKLLPIFFSRAAIKKSRTEDYINDLMRQLAKKIEADSGFKISIEQKVALSQDIIYQALTKYGAKNSTIAWTGGKDSTLILWMVRQIVSKHKLKMPECLFINEGHVFEEIKDFVAKWTKKWQLKVFEVHNQDVSKQAQKIGDPVTVSKLDKLNQREIKRLGYQKPTFPFEPESYVGNHLMKTVAMNRFLAKNHYQAVITGIRWDEQEARAKETYFSQRGDEFTPKHMRVHPILHFSEKEIWEAIRLFKVPYCDLYKEGYRSLGAKGTTHKAGDKPAWEQDFDKVPERAGRRQDKEGIMDNLRKLGYM
jgi:phosphoadenosine phosphosulfate reductase